MILKVMLASLLGLSSCANSATIKLTTVNSVTLRGEVNYGVVTETQKKIADLVKERGHASYPIYLVLDTPGGSVDAGESLIQYAKTVKNLETITIFAASMGAGIVEGLPGKRYITQNGLLMFHRAYVMVQGTINPGTAETELELSKKFVAVLEVRNAARRGLTLQQYRDKITNEEWLLASEAVKENAVDSIIDITCSQGLIEAEEKAFVQSIFGSATFTFSKCPLFRGPVTSAGDQ